MEGQELLVLRKLRKMSLGPVKTSDLRRNVIVTVTVKLSLK